MSKILMPLALVLSLSVFNLPCLSMEGEKGNDKAVSNPELKTREGANPQEIDTDQLFKDLQATTILAKAVKLQSEELPKLRTDQKKADLLKDIIEKYTKGLGLMVDTNSNFYKITLQNKATCLIERGYLLLLCHPTIEANPTSISDFREAHAHLQESCQILEGQHHLNLLQNSKKSFSDSLILLSHACIYLAHVISDPQEILTLCEESLKKVSECQRLFRNVMDFDSHKNIMDITLQKLVGVFDGVSAEYDTLCYLSQGNPSQNGLTNSFLGISKKAKLIIILMTTHYAPSRLIENGMRVRIPNNALTAPLNKGLRQLFQKMPTRMDPALFVQYPQAIFCGALRGASLACTKQTILSGLDDSQRDRLREMYQKQSEKLLNEAIGVYRECFYHHEYEKTPERENLYLIAALDDLLGNPTPLNEFYDMLRRERREKRRELSHEKMVKKIKESQRLAQEKQAKRDEEKRVQNMQTQHNMAPRVPLPTSNPLESFSPFEVEGPNERTSPRTLRPETKVKTRGEAVLGLQLKEEKPNEDVVLLEEERVIRVLAPEDYYVFCHLTRTGLKGEKPDNRITREQVIKLLEKLDCCIEPGGSHFKATDKRTNTVWTIPPAWDGPIHSGYRQQLNEFLQNLMDIDPKDVVQKGDKVESDDDSE